MRQKFSNFLTIVFVMFKYKKIMVFFLYVKLYPKSCSMTILHVFLTSKLCDETFKKSCISCPQHPTCSSCHPNSHHQIPTSTQTNKAEKKVKNSMMGRRPDLTLDQRYMAIGMLTAGMRNKEVASHSQVSENTISHLSTKFRQTGSVKDVPRTGRPRKMTRREDNYILT